MKVLVISASKIKTLIPAVPLNAALSVAALQEANHTVTLLDLCFIADDEAVVSNELLGNDYDGVVIALDCYEQQGQYGAELETVHRVVRAIKAIANLPTILTGTVFSDSAETIFQQTDADFGIIGETELALPELLTKLTSPQSDWSETPTIRGVLWRRDQEPCVEVTTAARKHEIMMPAVDRYQQEYRQWLQSNQQDRPLRPWSLVTRRGCPYACPYCRIPAVEGPIFRCRSMDSIIDELDFCASQTETLEWFLADRLFQFPFRHINELCRSLGGRVRGMKWTAYTCNGLESIDYDMLHEMAAFGCDSLVISIPGLQDDTMAALGKTYTIEHALRFARWIKKLNLKLMILLELGYPGETNRGVDDTLSIIEEMAPDRLSAQLGIIVTPYTLMARELGTRVLIDDSPFPQARFISPDYEPRPFVNLVMRYAKTHPEWQVRSVFGNFSPESCIQAIKELRKKT